MLQTSRDMHAAWEMCGKFAPFASTTRQDHVLMTPRPHSVITLSGSFLSTGVSIPASSHASAHSLARLAIMPLPCAEADGVKFAVFYTKLHNRLLRPLMAKDR
jgi:hypothetical protein